MPRRALTVPLALATLAAQDPVLQDVGRVVPGFRPLDRAQTMVDLDGDGWTDLLAVMPQRSALWLLQPDGSFIERHRDLPGAGGACNGITIADLDGDGDLDVVLAATQSGSSVPVRVLVNDGSGSLTMSPLGPLPGTTHGRCVAAGDLDGDGDQDVVVGVDGTGLLPPPWSLPSPLQRVFLNQGNGAFVEAPNSVPAMAGLRCNTATLFDQDGDGDLDLHVGLELASPSDPAELLLRNDGTGSFSAVAMASAIAGRHVRRVSVFDADGNTHPDLLVVTASSSGSGGQLLQCARNDGQGNFTALPISSHPTIDDVLVGDWNADGAMDLGVRSGDTLLRFEQAQPGAFQGLPQALQVGLRSVHAFDYDHDGDTDVLAPSVRTAPTSALNSELFRNVDGTLEPESPSLPTPANSPAGSNFLVRLVDLDGDGALDLVQAPWASASGGHAGAIWRGDGAGGFAPAAAGAFGATFGAGRGLAFGDVDGDGDVDIVSAVRPEPGQSGPFFTRLFLQNGGTFGFGGLPQVAADEALLGDLDGDGDLDCVLVSWDSGVVMHNDGAGVFTVVGSLPVAGTSSSRLSPAVMADFDGDGDLDVVTANGYLLANDGAGGFAAPVSLGDFGGQVVAADFDHDQDVDLVWEYGQVTGSACLLANQGGGTFAVQALPALGNVSLTTLHVADVDVDGFTDLIVVNLGGAWFGSYGVLWNRGPGGFVLRPGALPGAPDSYLGGDVGDIDGDGDIDLLVAGAPGFAIHRNLLHQLSRRGLPRVGRSLDIDLWGRSFEPYIVGFALARYPTPVVLPGLGNLWLDLGSLQVFGFGLHDASGYTGASTPIPAVPSLVGMTLHWQAMTGGAVPLGNVDSVTLLAN